MAISCRLIPSLSMACLALGWAAWASSDGPPALPSQPTQAVVRVGCKNFTESALLAEMLRALAQAEGASVPPVKRFAGTKLAYEGLRAGTIDVYVEYTGTLRDEILRDDSLTTTDQFHAALAPAALRISEPLGFDNSYALGMMQDRARSLGVTTITNLASHPDLRLGFSSEFMARAEGWPGLRQTYGLPHRSVRGLEHALAYQGLDRGEYDVVDVYTTDPAIAKYGLVLLEDDRGHFPEYQAVLFYRADLFDKAPEVIRAWNRLIGTIDRETMTRLNAEGEARPTDAAVIATTYLDQAGFSVAAARTTPMAFRIGRRTVEHLFLVITSLVASIGVCVPLAVWGHRQRVVGQGLLAGMEIVQTIPGLALLVILFALVGQSNAAVQSWIGGNGPASAWRLDALTVAPVLMALFLYSLLPVYRNTLAGLAGIPASLSESATVLGLTGWRRLTRIELPLASPMILAGIKTVAVINVGYAALGGLIGAGGYGQPIMEGLATSNMARVMEGAIPAAALAIVVKLVFEGVERLLVPRGLRLRAGA